MASYGEQIREAGSRAKAAVKEFADLMVGEPDPDKSDLERYGGLSLMPADSFTRESYGEERTLPREEREGRSDIPQWWSGYTTPQERKRRVQENKNN